MPNLPKPASGNLIFPRFVQTVLCRRRLDPPALVRANRLPCGERPRPAQTEAFARTHSVCIRNLASPGLLLLYIWPSFFKQAENPSKNRRIKLPAGNFPAGSSFCIVYGAQRGSRRAVRRARRLRPHFRFSSCAFSARPCGFVFGSGRPSTSEMPMASATAVLRVFMPFCANNSLSLRMK